MVSRRKTLALIGGGTVLAAAGAAAVGFVTTRTPHTALAPWEKAGGYADLRKWALSYAILAPSAHNRQPWLIGLAGDDTVILWRDRSRDLPHTDPFHRQLVISLGCFLEQMKIAAAEKHIGVRFTLYPAGEDGPVAVAVFEQGAATPDPLFAAILDRRTCHEPFTDQPLASATAEKLQNYATLVLDPQRVAALKKIALQAWRTEAFHPPSWNESVDLMRFGKGEINANPDGIDLGGPFLETLILSGILTRAGQTDPASSGFKQTIAVYDNMLGATPAFAVVTTPGNSRLDQIAAGRRWLRLHLAATALGVSVHPVSQALQEYREMAKHYDAVHDMLAQGASQGGETVQMLGRLGYGPAVLRSPRWPLESRFI